MTLSPQEFEVYKDFLRDDSGLSIQYEQAYLLEARLAPIMRRMELSSIDDLTAMVRANNTALKHEIIEVMTVHDTSFFRDINVFNQLQNFILPKIMEKKSVGSTIRIWCAACSSGQEAYSIAIALKENAEKFAGYNFEIIASDLSDAIVDTARRGCYTQFEVQRGMPTHLLIKYFKQDGSDWIINDDIKSMVQFKTFNLLDSMDSMGTMDIILCRNVLTYFDEEIKTRVLNALYDCFDASSFLLLGTTEDVATCSDKLKPMTDECGLYIPDNSPYL